MLTRSAEESIQTYIHVCILGYIHTDTYPRKHIRTQVHTYILHTNLYTYIHTYIYTYLHIHTSILMYIHVKYRENFREDRGLPGSFMKVQERAGRAFLGPL